MKLRKEASFILHSKDIEDDFKITVCLPIDYEKSSDKYPVVYVLDANIFYEIFKGTANLLQFGEEIPKIIVVGIGYPDESKHFTLRDRDYLHSKSPESELSGGANLFYDFLTDKIMKHIDVNYRVSESVLFGDSYSGLFALYALFQTSNPFSKYIIGSPSIYYDDLSILEYEKKSNINAQVFLGVGALEAIYEPAFANMVGNVEMIYNKLNDRIDPELRVKMYIFDNETHLSVIPSIMSRGLREVFLSDYMNTENK